MQTAVDPGALRLQSYTPRRACHAHPSHQIILPLEGALELETALGGGVVRDRRIAVVTAGREHAYRAVDDNRMLTIDVSDADAETGAPLWAAASERLFFPANEQVCGLLAFARGCGGEAFAAAGFRSSLGTLIIHGLTALARDAGGFEPEALSRAKAFVEARFAEPIAVGDIADAAHVSTATLYRLFHSWCDRSPAKYLNEVRLARARSLLTGSALPLARIASACGYSEQSALCRAMRRELGMSPGAYRRQEMQRGGRPPAAS